MTQSDREILQAHRERIVAGVPIMEDGSLDWNQVSGLDKVIAGKALGEAALWRDDADNPHVIVSLPANSSAKFIVPKLQKPISDN